MILARRTLLFSGVHKVSTTLWPMSRVTTGATSPELFGGIVASRVVFHRLMLGSFSKLGFFKS
jgi:hypothetical protein